ncbi:MAG: glycosyltransferase family 2 protein [Sporocytophaga sp.]|uniref:glycosyltransferase family 2 protein n=1 Tax=Sporocytophaga sp. TaxID=2231183 RepID=UPI001B210E70|nr:glycosyltransferase family 2 protein [Sporocytophaga sp.]MBO9703755.1 glycosyltransferase family 2 protein [Sporocytophaga sp.]
MRNVREDIYPLVSIVTINYNGADVTCALLESLRKITYPNVEIIVVDNHSKEDPGVIKERYPEIRLIRNKNNNGFAGGNNIGFKAAKGKYFLMLNNDTEVAPDFMEPLVSKLESDPGAGAATAKLIYYHSDRRIQFAGSTTINPISGRNKYIGQHEKDNGQYNHCCCTPYGHGAAMMIPRKVIQEVGLMPEMYFLYYEELDFCERIKDAGYSIWFVGNSNVFHKESATVGKLNPMKIYYLTRNRLLFMRRNVKGLTLYLSMIYFTFVALPKNLLTYLFSKKVDFAKAFMKGYLWNFKNKALLENKRIKLEAA